MALVQDLRLGGTDATGVRGWRAGPQALPKASPVATQLDMPMGTL